MNAIHSLAPPVGGTSWWMRWTTRLYFVLGGVMAGTAGGWVLYVLGRSVRGVPAAVNGILAMAAAIVLVSRLRGRRSWAPSIGWVVPRELRRLGAAAYAWVFGISLGVGFLTLLPSLELYLVMAVAALSPSLLFSMVLMTVYAVSRTIPLLVSPWLYDGPSKHRTINAMESFGRWRGLSRVAQLGFTAIILGTAIRGLL